MNSPMYNWIASRWWSSRADVLGIINHPVGPIEKNTTIKAVTIGPGKLDSDVAIFNYRVEGDEDETDEEEIKEEPGEETDEAAGKPSPKVITLAIGLTESSVDGVPYTLEAAPYLHTGLGRTLVPLRFVGEALGADVTWNSEKEEVTIFDGEREIVLTLGSGDVLVDGVPQTIDCPPAMLPPGRTFVPLRFVSETLGAKVDYKSESGEIAISK